MSFGAPIEKITRDDLTTEGTIVQIGVEPLRIDIITSIDGGEFDPAWNSRQPARFGDQDISVISRQHLVQNKRASGRTQDLADIEALEKLDEE
jgi:hypothetical protein